MTRDFIERPRVPAPKRPVSERVRDWREVVAMPSAEATMAQAARCMDCGIPFCTQGCPLGNPIPDFNRLVRDGRWHEAWLRLSSTNNFPEFTGRLCPAPCEAACTLALNMDAVTIEEVEKQIAERAFAEGWVRARETLPASGKRVAIVGSGPAGLAAAEQLALAGHEVHVFERQDQLGGLLRYGIPDFKLEKHVIDRRLDVLREQGVRFHTGVEIGRDLGWAECVARHDAVLLAIGALAARELGVPGRELEGVAQAMTFLEAQNRQVAGGPRPDATLHAAGKHVVVLGGGDTGSDCVGTAVRQGAASVRQIEILATPPTERAAENPWPHWPLVFRTSSSHEEGCERAYARMTTRLVGEGGRVVGLESVEARRSAEGGFEAVEGSEESVPCDLLVLAMGFVGVHTRGAEEALGVERGPRGALQRDARFRTANDKVWVAGDATRGASLIVWAIADGREAARDIDACLRRGASVLPTKGADSEFGA